MPPRRQKDQLDMGKKRPEEGDYRAKCTRTRQGRERKMERARREGERDREEERKR